MRVDESPVPMPSATSEAEKRRVMHAEFAAEGISFMASDGVPGRSTRPGDVVSLNVILDSTAEQDRIWARLVEGGTVTMPLQVMFWGARFGTVVDKFGVPWMLNCEVPAPA
jgi:PhnB protein